MCHIRTTYRTKGESVRYCFSSTLQSMTLCAEKKNRTEKETQ